jgi:hypothetical protein
MSGIHPRIVNDPDEFFYQVEKLSNYRGSAIYWWRNTGVRADVQQATTVTGGHMTLHIRDQSGAEVYGRSLADSGLFASNNGPAGLWTIQIVYDGASGSVSFRAHKRTE